MCLFPCVASSHRFSLLGRARDSSSVIVGAGNRDKDQSRGIRTLRSSIVHPLKGKMSVTTSDEQPQSSCAPVFVQDDAAAVILAAVETVVERLVRISCRVAEIDTTIREATTVAGLLPCEAVQLALRIDPELRMLLYQPLWIPAQWTEEELQNALETGEVPVHHIPAIVRPPGSRMSQASRARRRSLGGTSSERRTATHAARRASFGGEFPLGARSAMTAEQLRTSYDLSTGGISSDGRLLLVLGEREQHADSAPAPAPSRRRRASLPGRLAPFASSGLSGASHSSGTGSSLLPAPPPPRRTEQPTLFGSGALPPILLQLWDNVLSPELSAFLGDRGVVRAVTLSGRQPSGPPAPAPRAARSQPGGRPPSPPIARRGSVTKDPTELQQERSGAFLRKAWAAAEATQALSESDAIKVRKHRN